MKDDAEPGGGRVVRSLSQRGAGLLASPPLAPYVAAHFERAGENWDPKLRPEGYIGLCIAENAMMVEELRAFFGAAREVPPEVFAYDAPVGSRRFRERLARLSTRHLARRPVDPDHLVVLAGVGSVLEMLFYVLCDPGEAVLVPTPSYAGFWADLETRDELEIVTTDGVSGDDFALDVARLERAVAEASRPIKALLLTTPDNPLGRVYGRDALEAITAWAGAKGLHVIYDEIYALSVFGGGRFVSAAGLAPRLEAWQHVTWGFSKDFGASGLRCGVLHSENEAVLAAIAELAYWAECSGHTQFLLGEFLADDARVDAYIETMQARLGAAHERVCASLRAMGIPHLPASAGFFVVCDLRAYLEAPTWEGERSLWRRLIEEAKVNLTPGEACRIAEPGFFRLCYAAESPAAVEEALRRLGEHLGPARA